MCTHTIGILYVHIHFKRPLLTETHNDKLTKVDGRLSLHQLTILYNVIPTAATESSISNWQSTLLPLYFDCLLVVFPPLFLTILNDVSIICLRYMSPPIVYLPSRYG